MGEIRPKTYKGVGITCVPSPMTPGWREAHQEPTPVRALWRAPCAPPSAQPSSTTYPYRTRSNRQLRQDTPDTGDTLGWEMRR